MARERLNAIEQMLQRVQGEFLEMPGLRLTSAQAGRLWGLDPTCCEAVLGALVDAKFLFRTRSGVFLRMSDADIVRHPSTRRPVNPAQLPL